MGTAKRLTTAQIDRYRQDLATFNIDHWDGADSWLHRCGKLLDEIDYLKDEQDRTISEYENFFIDNYEQQ